MNTYDVVIIGGGAAGLSAALVLSRARRRVLVVDSGAPRNAPAAHLHGFLSRDGMPPANLLAAGRDEVRRYGGTITTGAATEAARINPTALQVRLADGDQVSTRRLLVATGLRDELPAIPGLVDRWGRDVLHCPYCHGWEVKDQPLGVLWHGPETVRYAQIVRQWSDDVVLFTPADALTPEQRERLTARAIGVVEGAVSGVLLEDDHLTGVRLLDGRMIPRVAVFVPPRFVPNNALLAGLGCELNEQGWVMTDATGATTIPGVWVAGNLANPRAQLITAAGEGSAAAIAINADLTDEDVNDAAITWPPATR